MSENFLISSMQNPRVKRLMRLRDRRERDKSQLFLIEGYRELRRACGRVHVETLYISPEHFLGDNEGFLIDDYRESGTQITELHKNVFAKVSYRDRPDGLLGVARQFHPHLSDLEELLAGKKNPFLLVAEAIEKPGNLGSMLRSADAVGCDAVIVCDRCTDIFNPNVVRASVGTLFTVPILEAPGDETLRYLHQHGIAIVATTPATEQEFTRIDLTGPVAIAVGTEQLGLSESWLAQATLKVRIPMLGVADSLNVAAATTLLLYEVIRQRRL